MKEIFHVSRQAEVDDMPHELRRQVTDVRALRALADPVRYRLLGHLMSAGPQTASECAAVVGASPSNCSYHLRQLARFGLVERVAAPRADGRDRPWRPTATGLRMGPSDDEGDPDPVAVAANRQLSHAAIDDAAALAHAAIDAHDDLPEAWRRAESMATYGLRVSAEELVAITTAIDAILRPYIGLTRDVAPAGAERVHVAFEAFVRPSAPLPG
jgi:predicted transcriptional regulator